MRVQNLYLHWPEVRSQRAGFLEQVRQSEREMLTGESHYFQGRRYRLNVVEYDCPPAVHIANNTTLELRVRPGADRAKRLGVLEDWYRKHLRTDIPELVARWEPVMGMQVAESRIRKMKTRWGSCNTQARRIWLNLELAKKPRTCLEYVVVHEMVHLLEQKHSVRFRELMNQFMPDWRMRKDELNSSPLAHEDWWY